MSKDEVKTRWKEAQQSERVVSQVPPAKRRLLSLEQRVAFIRETRPMNVRLAEESALVPAKDSATMPIVEIGGDTIDAVFPDLGQLVKVIIDPLADIWWQPEGTCGYVKGVGEELPLFDRSVGLCICTNTIDHVMSPPSMLEEIRRVLSDEGTLIISCNVFSRWVSPLFFLLNRLDRPHPHHFAEGSFESLVAREFDIEARFVTTAFAGPESSGAWHTANDLKLLLQRRINNPKVILAVACGLREVHFRCSPKSRNCIDR